MAKYEFVEGMREMSGFGGEYEAACRTMLLAGLQWMDNHPNADPRFKGFKGVFGILDEDNEDAKQLSDYVGKSVDGCTGAMHQCAISHTLYVKRNGWDKYVEEMCKVDEDDEDSA